MYSELSSNNDKQLMRKITRGSAKKVNWICSFGHEYSSAPMSRFRGRGCPYCSGNKVLPGFNDLKTTHPDLCSELDSHRSNVDVTKISKGSRTVCWWVCPLGHTYSAQVKSRVTGRGCAVCHGLQIIPGVNDLLTYNPDLAKELDEKTSGFKASEITPFSSRKAFWRCVENPKHTWWAVVSSRSNGRGCPKCVNARTSRREGQMISYIKTIAPESLVTAGAKIHLSPCREKKYEVDCMIDGRIIVEYDGSIWHKPEKSVIRDTEKTRHLLDLGYKVMRIRERVGNTYDLDKLDLDHENLTQIFCNTKYDTDFTDSPPHELGGWISSELDEAPTGVVGCSCTHQRGKHETTQ